MTYRGARRESQTVPLITFIGWAEEQVEKDDSHSENGSTHQFKKGMISR
jgi:hypothetical protein